MAAFFAKMNLGHTVGHTVGHTNSRFILVVKGYKVPKKNTKYMLLMVIWQGVRLRQIMPETIDGTMFQPFERYKT